MYNKFVLKIHAWPVVFVHAVQYFLVTFLNALIHEPLLMSLLLCHIYSTRVFCACVVHERTYTVRRTAVYVSQKKRPPLQAKAPT